MKKSKPLILLFSLLVVVNAAQGQFGEYNYIRPINDVKDQWHTLELPDDIYDKISPALKDIRVIKIGDGDTLEIPYLLKSPSAKVGKVDFQILNQTQKDDIYYYTFDVGSRRVVDYIQLEFGNENFDVAVSLEGSQDQEEWYEIVSDYRILSIKNNQTDYQFTALKFPKAQFQYFRLSIPSSVNPQFRNASISYKLESDEKYRTHRPLSLEIKEQEDSKQTIINAELERPIPTSSIAIDIDEAVDYYRTFQVKYLKDSFNTEKGWKYNYQSIYRGTLSSLENNDFPLRETVGSKFQVVVNNADNRPLKINGLKVLSKVHELVVRFEEPLNGSYFLLYGNADVRTPNYDIKNFKSSIPDHLSTVMLGSTVTIAHESSEQSPIFENSWWLWIVMIVTIAFLGSFSVRLLKGK
ncbi:MAG: DUF3999 family protein [Bacteroidota bacterium]